MKKILLRLMALSLLVTATFWFGNTSKASVFSCGANMFAAMNACDGSFSGKVSSYYNLLYASPSNCQTQADEAIEDCYENSPEPEVCVWNVYANCHNETVINYDNRYSSYESCLSGTIDYDCVHQPDYCPEAYARRDVCLATYKNPQTNIIDDYPAYEECIIAIPNKENCPAIIW